MKEIKQIKTHKRRLNRKKKTNQNKDQTENIKQVKTNCKKSKKK